MKGRIIGTLFALPFFGVGVWMLWSVSSSMYEVWDMRGWQPTPAQLTSAGYTTNYGDDSNTYEAYAEYSYQYFGQTFSGDRVGVYSGSDNIGDYQQDTGRQLSNAMSRKEPITVWVNPDSPNESIIDPTLRWGLLGFKSIFLFVFGGIGLGLLIVIWRAPKDKDKTLPEYESSPWLLNHDWQTATIRSSSKHAMWGAWVFAALWNLISIASPFLAYREVVKNQNYVALAALLFPLIGIGLIVWAVKRTREWNRFGATPVVLDPFPGSIGGNVGGTIDIKLPFASTNKFVLTLTCIHSYMSGSGDNRSRSESAKWQDETLAHTESTRLGTRAVFQFDVPTGWQESDATHEDDSWYLWRLNIRADIPGTDLDRDYEIPVYATARQSRFISAHKIERSEAEEDAVYDGEIRKAVKVSNDGHGKRLSYPMGRNIVSNGAAILIGGTFAAVGWYIAVEEGQRMFGVVFGGVGALVTIAAFYMMFKSLDVTLNSGTITSVRRVLGIPLRTRTMQSGDFHRFEVDNGMQAQGGGKHVMYFKVKAVDRSANELLLGDGFKSQSGVEAAKRFLSKELGLAVRASL